MIVRSAKSVLEFVQTVLELEPMVTRGDPADLWYRGVLDSSFQLLPGAYRVQDFDESSDFFTFQNLVPSLLPREPIDEWEWYYFAQHYGLRTRLLDWTESPLAALYFALVSTTGFRSPKPDLMPEISTAVVEGPGQLLPCVWMMNPAELNRKSMREKLEPVIYVPSTEKATRRWLPSACRRGSPYKIDDQDVLDNSKPLAIFPRRHNPRIVAQRGVFTVHGADETPIERLFQPGELGLARIEIRASDPTSIKEDLNTLGVTKTTIFPEPSSVAEDIRQD
jgi:hypothetical protein